MKKPLNTRQMILAAILLALVLACGAVFAYMFMRTDQKSTQFVPAKVSCEVDEQFNGEEKSSIKVNNTGNIDAYLRVRLVTYWVDGEGNVAAKSSPTLSISPTNDWIAGTDNTYYYPTPVSSTSPNNSTPDLLASPIKLETSAEGYKQVVDVFAEAIQAKPMSAAETAWGVSISGETITTVPTS